MADRGTSSSTSSTTLSQSGARARRFAVGAEYVGDGRTHMRVWAPIARTVDVVLNSGARVRLERESSGHHSGTVEARPGDRYQFALPDGERLYPDPASRFQPDGPHGPSQVIDPDVFPWSDRDWRGAVMRGQVIYEMHIGTF